MPPNKRQELACYLLMTHYHNKTIPGIFKTCKFNFVSLKEIQSKNKSISNKYFKMCSVNTLAAPLPYCYSGSIFCVTCDERKSNSSVPGVLEQ